MGLQTMWNHQRFGPSRLRPKRFPKSSICRKAIAGDVSGLLTPGVDGMCPLEPIDRSKDSDGIPIIRQTMVVRYKSVAKVKARLCVRGYLAVAKDITSAPIPYRSTLKVLLVLAGIGISLSRRWMSARHFFNLKLFP